MIVGIDPGREGAVVRISTSGAASWLLPYDDAGLSGRQLTELLQTKVESGDLVVLERAQSMPKQGIASAFRYGRDYGVILGVLDAIGASYQTVAPGVWHRAVVGGSGADPKARARAVVEARLPWLELRPGKRRKAHEGIVDAACLALYGLEVRRG